jgi:ribosomal protein L23
VNDVAEKKVAKKKESQPKIEKQVKPKRSLFKREKKTKEESEVRLETTQADPFDIIKFVVMTEKAIQLIEGQNKLVLVVERGAEKKDIKKAVESAFSANVSNVQTMIDQLGRKKAFVRFAKPGEAGEIAIKLGII